MSPPSTEVGGRRLLVGKIVAVGRNFADHAAEMGAERPAEPILFLKPPTALLAEPREIVLPAFSREIHHEVEAVLRISGPATRVRAEALERLVDGVAVGLDLTARDLQRVAKSRGEPWAVAKGFDGAAPIGGWSPVGSLADLEGIELRLDVNGERRQTGRLADLLFPLGDLLAFISSRFTLEPGDLVFTGTPSGVDVLRPGDRIVAEIPGRSRLDAVLRGPEA
jgi:acylpyruvate hydrolase